MSEPAYWRCRACGCLWRDNHDGSVSLSSAKQTSCVECETKGTVETCDPLFGLDPEAPAGVSLHLPDGWLDVEIELTAFVLAHRDCDVRAVLRGFAELVRRNDELAAAAVSRLPPQQERSEAERTVASIACMLGWENVPPRETLEAEIRTIKARLQSAEGRFGLAERAYERLALCPDHRDKANGRCIVCVTEERERQAARLPPAPAPQREKLHWRCDECGTIWQEATCPTCGPLVLFTAVPEARANCLDCGLDYADFPLDVILPRSQWLEIHPTEGGLLCAACIVKRAAKVPRCTAVHAVLEIAPPTPEAPAP